MCSVWSKPYLGPLVTLIFILVHLFLVKFNNRDIKIILTAIIMGFAIDSLFFQTNLIQYKGGYLVNHNIAPLWIVSMWAGFSITLLYTLNKIKNNYNLAMLLGLIGGPLSYQAGAQIGSISVNSYFAYLILSITWGLVTPLLFYIINQLEKMHKYLFIIIIFISLSISSNDELLDILYNEDGWELSDVLDDNSSIYFKDVDNIDLRAIKISKDLDINPQKVLDTIKDVKKYNDILKNSPYLVTTPIIDNDKILAKHHISVPIFSDLYYFFRIFEEQNKVYWLLQDPKIYNNEKNLVMLYQ